MTGRRGPHPTCWAVRFVPPADAQGDSIDEDDARSGEPVGALEDVVRLVA